MEMAISSGELKNKWQKILHMQESFQIKQALSLLEFVKQSCYILSRMKAIRMVFAFGALIGLFNGIITVLAEKQKRSIWITLFSFISLPLYETLLLGTLFLIITIMLYKLKPGLFKNTILRFTTWGMERINDQTNVTVAWKQFIGYRETGHFIYLFMNKDCHIVQKKFFKSQAELEQFRIFIHAHIS